MLLVDRYANHIELGDGIDPLGVDPLGDGIDPLGVDPLGVDPLGDGVDIATDGYIELLCVADVFIYPMSVPFISTDGVADGVADDDVF